MKASRRAFLKYSGVLGTGLVVGFYLGRDPARGLLSVQQVQSKLELTPFILIDEKGVVTLVNTNPDMGQGSTQAIPALIAEELEVALDSVHIVPSDGQSQYGVQISGGSGSVRRGWEPLRKAGAAAKEMLIKAAAERWQVQAQDCYAQNGFVLLKEGGDKKLSYGDLVGAASQYEVPQHPTLKSPEDFKIIGKYNKQLNTQEKITGRSIYGIDVEIPEMLTACVLHSPTIHGRIISLDDSKTKKVDGVLHVIKCERRMPHRSSDAVAVLAKNYWSAQQGVKALVVQWEEPKPALDSAKYIQSLYASVGEPGLVHSELGDFDLHYQKAENKLEAVYETPFLAHVPMEPLNATVHVKADKQVEVWAPIQGPDWARNDVAEYLGTIPEKVKVNVTLLGGSFGRKAYHDFLLEACFLSREVGKPVKVVWSREDDVTQGAYRPALLSRLRGALNNKVITGLHHHAVGESIDGQIHDNIPPGKADPFLSGEMGVEASNYQFVSSKVSYTRVKTDIPVMWWRSVYGSNFSWGQECFIDEMAHAVGVDPLKMRFDLLQQALLKDDLLKESRHRRVLEILAEKSNYDTALPEHSARGIAIFKCFGSISAACITVKKANTAIEVTKVVSVIDCGIYVNSDMVRAQTEGNIIMGLGAAIKPAITFSNGTCDQSNFHNYPIMKINEAPAEIVVHIAENQHSPSGVGEPGLPPIAPALGNAIFNLTGKRIRKLPIDLQALMEDSAAS